MTRLAVRRVPIWVPAACAVLMLAVAVPRAFAQRTTPEAACLRFAFGTWRPPLDWEGAGHSGSAEHSGEAARRLRDSIFLRQPGAPPSDGMMWDERSNGTRLFLFPEWWPAGVVIQFDSTTLAGDTLRGVAEAMVADGGAARSRATVRALRLACGSRR